MKQLIAAVLFACFLAVSATDSWAQQDMQAKKMEGHTWHQVVMVKFKPGKISQAKQIINNHFMQAGIESGTPGPQMMDIKSGEWDMMFIWTMNGIEDMDWEIHPDDEKWWKALVEQEGGQEAAMKVWQQYMELIDSSTLYLATTQSANSDMAMDQ